MIYRIFDNNLFICYLSIRSFLYVLYQSTIDANYSSFKEKYAIKKVLMMRFLDKRKLTDIDESQLIVAAKYGNEDAFAALIDKHSASLLAVAKRMVGNDRAEDVVQDAFLAAFKSLAKFRGDASFSTYLHTITINRCKYILKREKYTLEIDENSLDYSKQDADEAIVNQIVLEQALIKLPPNFKECLILRELSGFSYKEIAEILQINEGTVKSRMARARAKLKDILIEMGISP